MRGAQREPDVTMRGRDAPGIRRRVAWALACCLVLLLGSACGTTSGPAPSLLDATIPELQKAMETGELTAVELVDFYLARIAAYDNAGPKLNASHPGKRLRPRRGGGSRCRTRGFRSSRPSARHSRGPEGQHRNRRHADNCRIPCAEGVHTGAGRLPGAQAARRGGDSSSARRTSSSSPSAGERCHLSAGRH